MSDSLKILFVSRAYPPVVGGIERQNSELVSALGAIADVSVIANTRGKRYLPVFFVTAFFRALRRVRHVDVVLLGDGVLSLWGAALKAVSGRPVCSIVHGLDITYRSKLYQRLWVRYAMNRLDAVFAVGNTTIDEAVARGVARQRCRFIPNGTSVFEPPATAPGPDERPSRDDGVFDLLTLGRLVKRKGVAWFIAEVMPKLPEGCHYWVAGDGPDRARIEAVIAEQALGDRVTMLGAVTDEQKARLLAGADLFVQPNIRVPGDMEGFGLVVLEAAAAGLPVVASRLEGLQDAIVDGENGVLVEPGDSDLYAERISGLANQPEDTRAFGDRARRYVEEHCLWPGVATRYVEALRDVVRAG